MSSWLAVVLGLVLCLAGAASVHLCVILAGFSLGWILCDAFDASTTTTLIVALACALVSWILVTLVFRTALFFVGAILGGILGAKLYTILEKGSGSVVVAVVFVAALAFLSGWLANRWRVRALIWLTAFGGAALALHGLGTAYPDSLGALSTPDSASESIIGSTAWFALSIVGWLCQRRVSADALDRDRRRD